MMVAEVQTWTSAKAAGSCKHGVISLALSLQILNKLIRVKWSRKKKNHSFFFFTDKWMSLKHIMLLFY